MRARNVFLLAGIILLALVALWVNHPNFLGNPSDFRDGTYFVFETDMSKVPDAAKAKTLLDVTHVMERRLSAYGARNSTVRSQGETRVIVELRGVQNTEEAKKLVGQGGRLDFREQAPAEDVRAGEATEEPAFRRTPATPTEEPALRAAPPTPTAPVWVPATATGSDGEEKQLTGAYLRPNAQVNWDSANRPQVVLEFNDEGARLLEQLTTRLIRKPLGLFLDDQLVSAPSVQAVISRSVVITGLNLGDARILAILLNSGALPVPVSVVEERPMAAR